jgi:ABC-type transport system involved in multi-copper enzyme maturation permease subunit
MIGSILHQELLLGSRRGRLVTLRRIYSAWLILQFGLFFGRYCVDQYQSMLDPPVGIGRYDIAASGRFADSYLATLVTQQFLLMFLLAPAFVAGAITDEKSRGTLQYLLTSSLTTWEIVLGKLLGRLAHLGLVAVAALPFLCPMAPFGEFDLLSLAGVAVTLVLPLLAVSAASVLASVWARQTRDAVLALYGLGAVGYLAVGGLHELVVTVPSSSFLASWLAGLDRLVQGLNPLFVLEPAWAGHQDLAEFLRRLLVALAGWGTLTFVSLGLAVWRLRTAYMRQLEGGGRKHKERPWLPRRGAADEEEPIRWKEAQVEGIAPLAVLRRIPRGLGLLAVFAVTALLSGRAIPDSTGAADDYFGLQAALVFLIATAVVGVRCSGAVTGEREHQTWEALLLTPLPVRELVRNKVRGIIGAARPYLIAYAVPALVFAFLAGPVAFFWTAIGLLGLWPAMYFVGAAGIYYSVRSASSWKSLLATMGIGYVGGLVVCTASMPIVGVASAVILGTATLIGGFQFRSDAFGYALLGLLVVGWGWILWRLGERFIVDAQRRVIGRERTAYWVNGVNCGYATEQYMKQFESPHA